MHSNYFIVPAVESSSEKNVRPIGISRVVDFWSERPPFGLENKLIRKVIAVAAAPGLVAGICIFVGSFFGLTFDIWGPRALLLHLGIFALGIPLAIVNRWGKGGHPFRDKPRWTLRSFQILFAFFVAVFFTFLALSHAGTLDVINGDYVLKHGQQIEYISEQNYLFLKRWELRLFASGWVLGYYALMIHWWFPRQDEWTVVMPD